MLQDTMHEIGEELLILLRQSVVTAMSNAMLDERLDHIVRRGAGDFELVERLERGQTGGAAFQMFGGGGHGLEANRRLTAINARHARAASPPLSSSFGRARCNAWASSSTVRMPLPMHSPSRTIRSISPRADSLATISTWWVSPRVPQPSPPRRP